MTADSKKQASNERDIELLQAIAEGDKQAFSELYTKYHPRLLKYCSRIVNDDVALAADAVDDAMIEVWKAATSFSGRSTVSTWLYSIARFRLISRLRKNKEVLIDDIETTFADEETVDQTPDRMLDEEHMQAQVHKALEQLSASHKEVLYLTYFKDLSVKEIAIMLDVPDNTVKTRMFYARKHMQDILSGAEGREADV